MKKFLPIVLFLIGLLVVGGAFVFIKSRGSAEEETDNEKALLDVSLPERPVLTLTPSDDGHWLRMKIDKIKIDAASLDYLVLYYFPDTETGIQKQNGVPGTVQLAGIVNIERDLLMGSESSGNYKYDEGVTGGLVTLRFRNDDGQLLAKFESNFVLRNDTNTVSLDESGFGFEFDSRHEGYLIAMQTIGLPSDIEGVKSGPFGVFIDAGDFSGSPKLDSGLKTMGYVNNKWQEVDGSSPEDTHFFVGVSE
jgi:hypothetical protein